VRLASPTDAQIDAEFEASAPVDRRYELKLPLLNRNAAGIWSSIRRHPLGFEELHPPRQINNVYFDTPHLSCFTTSIAGVSRRLKLRLRWYGESDDVGKGQLEWKWRAGNAGWKWSAPVAWEGNLAKQSWSPLRDRFRSDLDGRQRATFDALSITTLLNRYRRSYFISRDGRCRLTLDEDLSFIAQTGGLSLQTLGVTPCRRMQVLEVKVAYDEADVVRSALQGFPYRPARFSKYTTGLELFLGAQG
jgi:hypothetical protein